MAFFLSFTIRGVLVDFWVFQRGCYCGWRLSGMFADLYLRFRIVITNSWSYIYW